MEEWIPFEMKEKIESPRIPEQEKGSLKCRDRSICEKCRMYYAGTAEHCKAMNQLMEALAMIRVFNQESIPFEKRDVPPKCEFYTEQFVSHIEKLEESANE